MKKNSTAENTPTMTTTDLRIFVDLDGVLADFKRGMERAMTVVHGREFEHDEDRYEVDTHYRKLVWSSIDTYQDIYDGQLWLELDTMADSAVLWRFVLPFNPEILTATGPKKYRAREQKLEWVPMHFGREVRINIVERAVEKANFAAPNHILIDDKMKAIGPWRDAGGIGILHTSAEDTIRQLKGIGI